MFDFKRMFKWLFWWWSDSNDVEDQLDAHSRFSYVSNFTSMMENTNLNAFSDAYKIKDYESVYEQIEDSVEEFNEVIRDLKEEEPDEDLWNDMSLVKAALKYFETVKGMIPDLKKVVDAAKAGDQATADKLLDEWNAKEAELTDEWNKVLDEFIEKHNVPWESPM